MLGLGITDHITEGSAAVAIEDYLWSSTDGGTAITPRFSNVILANVQDFNDAWDAGGVTDWTDGDPGRGMMDGSANDGKASINELMPSTDATSGNSQAYLSDDEGYWVRHESSFSSYNSDLNDMLFGQDGDSDSELTPIAIGNFPIGDGNYVA
tara:strand:- start:192 stop:650 length:459 start_codon:yes stop_codon:yes gene_type:complete